MKQLKWIVGSMVGLMLTANVLAMNIKRDDFSVILPDTSAVAEAEDNSMLSADVNGVVVVIASTSEVSLLSNQATAMKKAFQDNARAKEVGASDVAERFNGSGSRLEGKTDDGDIVVDVATFTSGNKGFLLSFAYSKAREQSARQQIQSIMQSLQIK